MGGFGGGQGNVAVSVSAETIAIAALSEISGTSGTGSTVVLTGSPTITTPTNDIVQEGLLVTVPN